MNQSSARCLLSTDVTQMDPKRVPCPKEAEEFPGRSFYFLPPNLIQYSECHLREALMCCCHQAPLMSPLWVSVAPLVSSPALGSSTDSWRQHVHQLPLLLGSPSFSQPGPTLPQGLTRVSRKGAPPGGQGIRIPPTDGPSQLLANQKASFISASG